jgi:pimeloyl-ACP methyl ester carboxylesterase
MRNESRAARSTRPAADPKDDRERLLAALPLTPGRLHLAGVSTAVLTGGEGRPVVLLHGPGGHAAEWMRVVPGLVGAHHVVVPELPGHGASEAVEGELNVDRVLVWLGEVIEETCALPPVLVGHSLGGAVAARFAAREGRRLDRLVLVDTLGLRAFEPAPEFGAALQAYLAEPTEETLRGLWTYCVHDADALRASVGTLWEPFDRYTLDRARSARARPAFETLMAAFAAPAIPEHELARIDVPTTLIWGRHDLATPLEVARAASARHGWPLHVIDACGDEPALERPDAFLAALGAVLDAAPATTASAPSGR